MHLLHVTCSLHIHNLFISSINTRHPSSREAAVPQDPAVLRQAVERARAEFGLPDPGGEPPDGPAGGLGSQRPSEASGRARLVHVERPAEVEAVRKELPILGMEQEVMEAVLEHDVVVLSGETGCGKTTQACHSPCASNFEIGYQDCWAHS